MQPDEHMEKDRRLEANIDRTLKILDRYYYAGLSTADVVSEFGIKRSTFFRTIAEAKQRNCIKTFVDAALYFDVVHHEKAEDKLKERFPKLKSAYVLDLPQELACGNAYDYRFDSILHELIGKAGEEWLYQHLESNKRIGFGSGRALEAMASAMATKSRVHAENISLHSIAGGTIRSRFGIADSEQDAGLPPSPDIITMKMASTLIASSKLSINTVALLATPPYIDSSAACTNPILSGYEKRNPQVDIAIIGIGSVFPNSRSLPITDEDVLEGAGIPPDSVKSLLANASQIDNALSRSTDGRGMHVLGERLNRLTVTEHPIMRQHPLVLGLLPDVKEAVNRMNTCAVGLTEDAFRGITDRVGLAGGAHKVLQIWDALRSDYINHIVTDRVTAIRVANLQAEATRSSGAK